VQVPRRRAGGVRAVARSAPGLGGAARGGDAPGDGAALRARAPPRAVDAGGAQVRQDGRGRRDRRGGAGGGDRRRVRRDRARPRPRVRRLRGEPPRQPGQGRHRDQGGRGRPRHRRGGGPRQGGGAARRRESGGQAHRDRAQDRERHLARGQGQGGGAEDAAQAGAAAGQGDDVHAGGGELAMASTYTAKDIQALEGLEPVRKRPAMYIGGADARGYHHLLWEIVDNSIDEVINGNASRVDVTLHADGKSITVADNGRGIPVDEMPKFKKPALEVILTTLHSGGKFGGDNYLHSGGLHGVGSSVVNALSEELVATGRRDGGDGRQTFSRGKATSRLKKVRDVRGQGTTITFQPDPEVFGERTKFDAELIRERLEGKSYLHRGMKVAFVDETQRPAQTHEYQHAGGI